jgi:hypothetical protein
MTRFMSGNVTVTPDLPNHQLLIAFSLAGNLARLLLALTRDHSLASV